MEDEELVEDSKPPTRFKDHVASKALGCCRVVKKSWVGLVMFLAILLAIVIAVVMRQLNNKPYTDREVMYAEFIGNLFLRVLRAITIPVFLCSVISALGTLNLKLFGKLSLFTIIYFAATSTFSAVLGLVLVLAMNPARYVISDVSKRNLEKDLPPIMAVDTVLDFMRNAIPDNIVQACMTQSETKLTPDYSKPMNEWDYTIEVKPATNYVGLVIVALFIGAVMGYKDLQVKSLLQMITSINEIFMKLTFFVIIVSPLPIISLMIAQILKVNDWEQTLQKMVLYVLCNLIGFAIIDFVLYPAIYFAVIRKNPFMFFYNSLEIYTAAFMTSSSIATLPVTLKCTEEINHVDKHVTRFVMPLGATINMNGAALYAVVAPVFVAQMYGVHIGAGQYVGVCLLAIIASFGAAGVPQGAVVTMVTVLNFLNAPPKSVGIILAMDWLIDRFETAVNIMGDVVGSAVLAHISRKDLEKAAKIK